MRRALVPGALIVAATLVVAAHLRVSVPSASSVSSVLEKGPGTSRSDLKRTVEDMTSRLAAHPNDSAAVVKLADTLIRLQRVNNDGRAVITAEEYLRTFLAKNGSNYDVERTLAAVLLSQHRFADAIKQAQSLQARDPRDAWNYGAMGDGYLELGDYDRAFAAFDRMGHLQPGPSVYARMAYALELKGDLDGALQLMKQASDGTTPNDAESQAWHFTQLGMLLLQQGRAGEARLQFEHAAATFPNHPLAIAGLARVKIFEKDLPGARLLCQQLLAQAPTPDMAALVGDLSRELGDRDGAEQYYRMSEQIERAAWGNGLRQPQVLARFFAEHDRNIPEAVTLAEEALRSRQDIFTMDTAAWAYFKAGRLADARQASQAALRTGTRDARILYHAAEILAANGDAAAARDLLSRIPSIESGFLNGVPGGRGFSRRLLESPRLD